MREDLVIVDEEFENEFNKLELFCSQSKEMLELTITHLNNALATMEGNTATNIATLVSEMQSLQENFTYINDEFENYFSNFLDDIENADSWLYSNE